MRLILPPVGQWWCNTFSSLSVWTGQIRKGLALEVHCPRLTVAFWWSWWAFSGCVWLLELNPAGPGGPRGPEVRSSYCRIISRPSYFGVHLVLLFPDVNAPYLHLPPVHNHNKPRRCETIPWDSIREMMLNDVMFVNRSSPLYTSSSAGLLFVNKAEWEQTLISEVHNNTNTVFSIYYHKHEGTYPQPSWRHRDGE